MSTCSRGLTAAISAVLCLMTAHAANPFVAAVDEGGMVYVADWVAASNSFINFRQVFTSYRAEGEYPYVRGIVTGDFDGDGLVDIVAPRRIYHDRVAIHLLLNDGANNFEFAGVIGFYPGFNSWVMDGCAGDFNHDGVDDFTFNGENNCLHIWTSNGAGGFDYAVQSNLRSNGRATDCADLNHDGILDIFRNSYNSGSNSQFLQGNGDGTFKAPVDFPNTGSDPYGMALADFDSDGDIDRISNEGGGGDAYYYENTGDVRFAAALYVPSLDVNNHGSYDAFDYDGDGYADMVVTDYSGRRLLFFRSNGEGTFTNSVTVGVLSANCMAVAAMPLPALAARPSAVIVPAVQRIPVNTAAALDGSASSSPGGVLVSHQWIFGDGDLTPLLAAADFVTSHVYTAEGHYRPVLAIADEAAQGARRTADVFVTGDAPQVITTEILLAEGDAVNGEWPVNIPVTNIIADTEGLTDYRWAVSNYIQSSFEEGEGAASGWSAMAGLWVVTNSHAFTGAHCYRQMNTAAPRTRNMLDRRIDGDFIFEVDFMIVGGTGQEVILNLSGFGWYNTYDIIIRGRGANDIRIDQIVDNGTAVLYNNSLGFALTNNMPVHAEVRRLGDEITVWINNRWVASTCNATWPVGRIGLGTYSCDTIFDNVRVHLVGRNRDVTALLSEGTHAVNIQGCDAARQLTNTVLNIICTNSGALPVADAGSDIFVDESTALNGGWEVQLDGTASADPESEPSRLSYRWDPGTESFDGTDLKASLWFCSSSVYQTNQMVVPDQGTWGQCYAVTRQTVERCGGAMFQARIRCTNNAMAGFFHTSGFSYAQMPYAFYFNSGNMSIYEDGSQRRFVSYYNTALYYDLRIVLKESQGALYYMRAAGDTAWVLMYDSNYSSATALRRGITLESGTAYLDDLVQSVYGVSPTLRLHGTGLRSVELTVTDPAGNRDSDTVQVTVTGNDAPVADAGPDQVRGEADAYYRVWNLSFDGAASTDDFGIFKYEWDWSYSGAFHPSGDTGLSQSHSWGEPGVYTIALRVTDHALQTHVDTATVTITGGTPPAASHGGPYQFDEFTGNASNGYWVVALDASGSSDSESTNLYARWSLGEDPLDDGRLLDLKWEHDAGTVITNGMLRFGADGANHYAYTRQVFSRTPGLRAEARVRTSAWNTEQVFGFKTDDGGVGWNNWVYGVAMDNGQIAWWEKGTLANTGFTYNQNEWYDFRIELKESAGALYYYKPAASNEWVLVRDSNAHSTAAFRRGFLKHSGTTVFEADSYHEWVAGIKPVHRLYLHHLGTHDVELTLIDQALNTHTVNTTITCSANDLPVAAYHPFNLTLDENQAVNGVWEVPFNALLSSDDHGIMRYEWDVGYEPSLGFLPENNRSPTMVYQFTTPGTTLIALRVTDHLLQQQIVAGQVTRLAGSAPTALLPSGYTVEKGWLVEFDGTASTDDSGVVRYEWEFGDGNTGEGGRPVHVYRTETNCVLRLRVYDGVGQMSNWATAMVAVVTSSAPTAVAGSGYTGGAGGPPVYFDGSASTDNIDPNVIQGVVRYNWDIDIGVDSGGDGNPSNDVDYVVSNPFHTYALSGVYTSRLVVVDGPGNADTNDVIVTIVADLPPDVICVPWHGDPEFYHKAISGEPVILKAVVRDAGALTHQWLFGDGSSSAVTAVNNRYAVETTHTYYGVPGQPFTATLIVRDGAGNSAQDEYLVKLAPPDDTARADIAIDNGLWWLHKDQDKSTGRWVSSYGGFYASANGSALHALQINAHMHLGDPAQDPYVETIRLGFNYLFQLLTHQAIGMQGGHDPDSNGNGIGVLASGSHAGYQSGMVMDAIASSRALLAVAPSGATTNVKHRFFLDILTDMVDEYAWGQHDSGGERGGWRYDMNGGSDNSAAQWGAIGMLAAKDMFGITIPQFVIDENRIWLSNSGSGGNYGYQNSAAAWGYHSTTPSAMVQMSMDNIQTTDPIWFNAEDQIRSVWPIESLASKLYYGYYAFVKAMRSAKPSPVKLMHADGFDWYADPAAGVRMKVTAQQDPDGSWYAYAQSGNGYPLYKTMSTAWAIAMLTPSLFSVPPVAVIDAPYQWAYDTDLVLSAAESYHPDKSRRILKYSWDLNGDGIYTVITNEPHTVIRVHDSGRGDMIVTVRLRITDDNSPAVSAETTLQIRFSNAPFYPFAVPGERYTGYAEVPLAFDASASWDLDGDTIVSYIWDFTNDGTTDLITATPTAFGTYDTVGEYTAMLQVVDDGLSHTTSRWEFVAVSIGVPPLYPLPVAVDDTSRVWTVGGDSSWTGQIVRTHDGIDAGGSPALQDLESAWFETTYNGPGTVSFWWKVSSEAHFDWLFLYMDGELWRGITGEVDWQLVTIDLPEAEHTLRWEYRKDKSLAAGRDQGFVDQIAWSSSAPQSGFAGWLATNALTGVAFDQLSPDDLIPYGFEYAFGLNPSVSNDITLIGLTFVGGLLFVDTPRQDPATLPYVDLTVQATTNLVTGPWYLHLAPTNHASVPAGREWWAVPAGERSMFFKLRAEER